ncbi:MAG TPA: AraC family transcriptional regulator [Chryseolinea sp.]
MVYTLLNILSTIVIFQLLLLSVFLFSVNRGKSRSNKLLASFFVLLAINLTDGLLVYFGFYEKFPAWAHVEDGFVFLIGPVLFFYTKSVVYRKFEWKAGHLLHLIPFISFTVVFQIYYHLQTSDYQHLIQSAIQRQQLPAEFYFSVVLVYAHVGTYLYFAYRQIIFYRQQLQQRFSQLHKRNLDWLMFMILSVAVMLLITLMYSLLPLATQELLHAGLIVVIAFIFGFVNTIVWKALNQPLIFSGVEQETEAINNAGFLTDLDKADYDRKVQQVIRSEQAFLNSDLTLDDLADRTNIPSKKLSHFINDYYKQNFFDFVNSCRINEAKRILTESNDPKLTVLEVMYQSGFNSKSSFNTLFKKKTGQTPSEFRKGLQK